jgi:2-polyprenyl-6-methoxyphenol hydroxylase-like FAD-dependent oxidoreductase
VASVNGIRAASISVDGIRSPVIEAGPPGAAEAVVCLSQRAREVGVAEIIELTERGETIGPVMRYAFPYSLRRRYERLSRFPSGYPVMGDALASFNPIYGQGMTVAACEAMALRDTLAHGLNGLARRFFRAAAKVVDIPWQLAVGSDLALPCVPGPRPLAARIINAYIARLQRAATRDPAVSAAFVKVIHLVAAPTSLFAPGVFLRVMRGGSRPPSPGLALPSGQSAPCKQGPHDGDPARDRSLGS